MDQGTILHEPRPCPFASPLASIDQCPFPPHERSELRPLQPDASISLCMMRSRSRVNFSPGPHVTYSAENKYSWNPYYRLETENDVKRSKDFPEECNGAPFSGPCPIALTPRQGQCMARCSNTSSSTGQSPMHTFGCETPAIVSRCELSPQFSSVKSESGRALVTGFHSVEENSITDSTCVSHLDTVLHGLSVYSSVHPVGEVWPLNEMNPDENVSFDTVNSTRTEHPQQHRYSTPLFMPQNQPTLSSYPYAMEPRSPQPAPVSYTNSKTSLLRFSKMLPPPVRCEAVSILEKDNPHLSLFVLYNPVRRWYEHIRALQNEDYSAWLGGNCNTTAGGKGVHLELGEPCPAPPSETEQTQHNMSLWLKECNEWWDRQFSEKSRHVEKRRYGGGRGKWKHYCGQCPYHNHNTKSHNANRGTHFDGENAFLRRGGRY